MEEEQLQPIPEPTQEPVAEDSGQPDLVPATNSEEASSENPVNTGVPEPSPDPGSDSNYENPEKNDAEGDVEDQTGSDSDGETDPDEEGDGSVTNITIVRPPAQIAYSVSADTEATYHVSIENEVEDPVPVLVTETLIEQDPDPGIMEKKLEDYSVTEALLLLILLTLWLRMIFDYFGRRKS